MRQPTLTPQSLLAPNTLEAWEQMITSLPDDEIQFFDSPAGLQLEKLTGYERILNIDPENWVNQYEKNLAALDRKARKQGTEQTGVFYTPPEVARYLVKQSLGLLLDDTRDQMRDVLKAGNNAQTITMLEKVQTLKIVDPACGTGIFLVEALKVLHAFYTTISSQFPKFALQCLPKNPARWIFTHQLYGSDIDPLAIWITEARLMQWVRTLERNTQEVTQKIETPDSFNLQSAASNLFVGDAFYALTEERPVFTLDERLAAKEMQSVITLNECLTVQKEPRVFTLDERLAAKEKQVQNRTPNTLSIETQPSSRIEMPWHGWRENCPEIFCAENSGWDFIIGNPPYVSEVRKQAKRFRALRSKASGYYQAKMDLCDAFIAWGLDHLKADGQLVYVLPEYWTHRTHTASIRKRLWAEGKIRELWAFPETPLFAEAPGHHSALLIWQKNHEGQSVKESYSLPLGIGTAGNMLDSAFLRDARAFLDPHSGKLLYGNSVEITLLQQLAMMSPLLSAQQIQQGLVMPQGRLRPSDREKLPETIRKNLPPDTGLFLLNTAEIEALHFNSAEKALLKPYFSPRGFDAFTGFPEPQPTYSVIYTDDKIRKRIANEPETYPNLRAHLENLQSLNTSAFAPYGLHRARQPVWFEGGPRILCPRQVAQPAFAVVDFPAYVSEGFYVIQPDMSDPWLLIALLNSRLAWFWLHHQKRKGARLQIDKDVLICFPAPPDQSELKKPDQKLIDLSSVLSTLRAPHERKRLQAELDNLVAQRYGLSEDTLTMLSHWKP